MATVPAWSAARSGLLGDTGAVDASAQINQFLGTHGITVLYRGSAILTPNGSGGTPNGLNLFTNDWSQPFAMSGTTVGRVTIPAAAVGNGADLTVSLCPNASGSPGTPITTTRIPATWITNLQSSGSLATATNKPLATASNNQILLGPSIAGAWASPAVGAISPGNSSAAATSGNHMFLVGGLDAARANTITSVFTLAWTGSQISTTALPQPSLPAPRIYTEVCIGTDTIIVGGGKATPLGTTFATDVWSASWNPGTGVVGAWSTQASLPIGLGSGASTAWNDTVYIIGGTDNSQFYNTVYWATIANGQVTAWNSGPAYPMTLSSPAAAVIGDYLIVMGGEINFSSPTAISNVYYAAINPDGSLGAWQAGPSLPTAASFSPRGNYNVAFTDSAVILVGVASTENWTLSFDKYGPGQWRTSTGVIAGVAAQSGAFTNANGGGTLIALQSTTTYYASSLHLVPTISVPLPATGLTNGATYHVVISQQGGDLNDYLTTGLDVNVYPGSPTALFRTRFGGSAWATTTAGNAIPITIYDQTATGQPLHFWEDGGGRISTMVYTTTPESTPLGIAEAVVQPAPVLNANPTFTTGTASWTVTGGALTQSATHTHGNLPFSGLLTPSGSASSSYIESEKIPVLQGHNYVATAWLYSGPGYGSCAVNINWYNASLTLLSTTSGTVTSLSAGTWTQLSIASTTAAPAGAYYGTIVAAETGTPPSSATLWVSSATLQDASGPMLASVSQINYSGTGLYQPPAGITQLA